MCIILQSTLRTYLVHPNVVLVCQPQLPDKNKVFHCVLTLFSENQQRLFQLFQLCCKIRQQINVAEWYTKVYLMSSDVALFFTNHIYSLCCNTQDQYQDHTLKVLLSSQTQWQFYLVSDWLDTGFSVKIGSDVLFFNFINVILWFHNDSFLTVPD